MGDHVKVSSGQREGQTGMVVRVEDPICILVSDSTWEELQVFTRDLTESCDISLGLDTCAPLLAVPTLAWPLLAAQMPAQPLGSASSATGADNLIMQAILGKPCWH